MPLPSTVRDVVIDALAFRIRSGPVPAGAEGARPAVLLHGLGMSQRPLGPLQDRLALHRPVHVVELPGFGGRPAPSGDVPIETMIAALARALELLAVHDAVVVGHSLGAQWAVELAAQRPDLASAVVLVNPVVDERRTSRATLALAIIADFLREPPSIVAIMVTDVLRTNLRWFFAQAERMLRYPLLDRVALLASPVLVVGGGRDTVVSRSWLRRLRDAARGSLVIVPRAAHNPQFTAPGAVAEAVDRFLEPPR